MATRGRIGIQLADDSVLSVYHHWDSYPEWLGRILTTHYNSKDKASELIDGGDMSSCWTDDRWTGKQLAPYVIEQKKSKEYGPQYYSQRGDSCPPRYDQSVQEFLNEGEEYSYIFRNGEWICYNMNEFDSRKGPEIVAIPAGELAV